MSESNKNTSELPSPMNVMRNVENSAGEARNIQVTRLVSLIEPLKIDGQFDIPQYTVYVNWKKYFEFSEHGVTFAPEKIVFNGRVGVTKILIEWNDYQSECFSKIIYSTVKKENAKNDEIDNKES